MTDILATQLPFQQFASNMSLHVKRCNFQEIRQNSAGTTRSGTPESKESYTEPGDEFNYGRQTSGFHPSEEGFEIGVKPKKRQFKTEEERQRFVDNYKKKIKTELCKNYELRGWCKFGDNCSFAHGKHELQEKTHLHTKYKTKPCQQFHLFGNCNYGNRCQYLHSEAIMPNIFYNPPSDKLIYTERMSYSYSLLNEVFRLINTDCKVDKILSKIPKK